MHIVGAGTKSLCRLAGLVLLAAWGAASGLAATPEEALEQFLARTSGGGGYGARMELDIEASLPGLHRSAKLRAVRSSEAGRSTFQMLEAEGDAGVRREVIARYLALEADGQAGADAGVAISPANYKFRFQGTAGYGGRDVYVYRLEPKRRRAGLFKGELWLEPETGVVLREWGRFVKSPSWFVKHLDFVRDFSMERRDAQSWVVRRLIVTADTRLVGRAEMTIWFARVAPEQEAGRVVSGMAGGR